MNPTTTSDLAPLGSMVCTSVVGLRCLPCANDDDDAASSKEVVVENDEDIEAVLTVFTLPDGERTKQCETAESHGLKKGEEWCMMDSGAGCHSTDTRKEFPHHRRR